MVSIAELKVGDKVKYLERGKIRSGTVQYLYRDDNNQIMWFSTRANGRGTVHVLNLVGWL
jgi:hypothetical protein